MRHSLGNVMTKLWQTGNFLVPATAPAPVTDIQFGQCYVLCGSLLIGTFYAAVCSLLLSLLQFGHWYVIYCSLVIGTLSTAV